MPVGSAYLCEAKGCEARVVSYAETAEERNRELNEQAAAENWETAIEGAILCGTHRGTSPELQYSHCRKCGIGLHPPAVICDRCE